MSWAGWPGAAGAMAHQSALLQTPVNSAPPVMAPGASAAPNPMQYTPEQWAQAQQQNWQQWAQWQQQYQQWHQQYGAEYQKSLTAMQTVATGVQPPLPVSMPGVTVAPQPPLPTENPPLPPEETPKPPGYNTAPPPLMAQGPYGVSGHQQQYGFGIGQYQQEPRTPQQAQKRPYDQRADAYQDPSKRPYDGAGANRPGAGGQQWPAGGAAKTPLANQKFNQSAPQATSTPTRSDGAAASKQNTEELSEAEKKFDKEFAAWEAQFNKWKEQNVNHPDKAQYREYEKKWESWRNSLLERREQMRKKRLALAEAASAATPSTPATKQAASAQPTPPIGASGRETPYGGGGRQPPQGSQNRFGAGDGASPYSKPPPNVASTTYGDDALGRGDGGGDFLKTSGTSAGGIPGLDLVKDGDDDDETSKGHSQDGDVIELDKDDAKRDVASARQQGPDFAAISKGINTILGDQKLLSMLSKVSQNQPLPGAGTQPVLTDTIAGGFTGGKPDYSAPPPSFQNFRSAPPPGSGGYSVPPPAFGDAAGQRSSYGGKGRNEGDYYDEGEPVNNFDDQTQSSFHDDGFRNNRGPPPSARPPSLMALGGGKLVPPTQNDRFGAPPPEDRFSGPPPNDRFSGPPPNDRFGRPPPGDRFGGPPPGDRFGGPPPNDRFSGPPPSDRFSGPPPSDRYGAPPPQSAGRGAPEDKLQGRQLGNNRFQDRGDTGGRNTGNFGNKRNSFGRIESGNYGDYDEYNEEEDYDKYHEMFSEDDQNQDMPPRGGRFGQQNERGGWFGSKDDRGRFGPQGGRGGRFEQDDRGGRFGEQGDGRGRFDSRGDQFDDNMEEEFDQEPPRGPPPLMQRKPMDLPPPVNEAPPPSVVEEPQLEFEIIDYDHKSKKSSDFEVIVEPSYMFDYRHKPLNRIPYPQRPGWLAEAVKFIREFDPLAPLKQHYERVPIPKYEWNPNEHIPGRDNRRDVRMDDRNRFDRDRYNNGNRRHIESFDAVGGRRGDRPNRGGGSMERNRNDRERYDDRNDRNDRYDRTDRNRPDRRRRDFRDNDRPMLRKEDLEELSDDALDEWERDDNYENRRSPSPSMGMSNPPNPEPVAPQEAMIDDILSPPGRFNRPPRIVIILRGPPGSGKTYLAKLIKDKEVEQGGSAPRILSLDDYFMVEQEQQIMEDGKTQMVKEMVYEYEAEMEESYRTSLMKSFKKTVTDGYFPFIIVDNINDKVKHFGEMWSFAKQNGFQVYICQLDLDPVQCTKRNIHNRSEQEIEDIISGWEPTPNHHPTLDASSLLQGEGPIQEVEMEVVEEVQQGGVGDSTEGGEDQHGSAQDDEDEPEQGSMGSTNRSNDPEPWRTTSGWRMNGSRPYHPFRGRRGFGGPIWKNRGNRQR
ncbi:unnamed protein product [Acanthoscelides obtectus]|uniref:YLP motif-containing protein 1 n=1 Tax=Acanthoscelides obtectus TaxID=200917 RepID=A0A9P0JVH7_ACAOB|nr:unnamed protein product [Acanthoscelides obtectus]CAK1666002.1 YLP motif-containing protein 1 [Acanthoscelides obtectus]